jgi:hypothetical protein
MLVEEIPPVPVIQRRLTEAVAETRLLKRLLRLAVRREKEAQRLGRQAAESLGLDDGTSR